MDWLLNNAYRCPNRTSIFFRDMQITYRELLENISDKYNFIRSSVPIGSIVSLVSDCSLNSISLFFALLKHGSIIVPISSGIEKEVLTKQSESYCQYTIKSADSFSIQKLFCSKTSHRLIDHLRDINHAGLILFSSGSTGKAKPMLHDLTQLYQSYKKEETKDINTLLFMNIDHIGGIDTLFRTFSICGSVTIPEHRDPESICRLIERYRVTVLPSPPTFLSLLLLSESYKDFDLSSLEIIAFGAEAMPEFILKKLSHEFPKIRCQQKYGTSETSAIRIINKSPNSLYFKIEDENVKYTIVNEELWLKSNRLMLGYLDPKMDNLEEDGWFRTGDLVEHVEDGYLKIVGRNKDIINVGGLKVFPIEVESTLLKIPSILDCLVYGEKNLITGQSVSADIVFNKVVDKKEAKMTIMNHCRKELEPYKIPTKINIIDKIDYSRRYKKIRNKFSAR